MKIAVFLNSLGLGGTEKAALRWARGLKERKHDVTIVTLVTGPRKQELQQIGLEVRETGLGAAALIKHLHELSPDVIHAHSPGFPHQGDVLGQALERLPKKIPVVETNIFGRLENAPANEWTSFRLFVSWTSCAQAAERHFRPLDEQFFQRQSVAVYPLDADNGPIPEHCAPIRIATEIEPDMILWGRFSRPEPNKWTDLPLEAFRLARKEEPRIRLLLREPPPAVAQQLRQAPDKSDFVILPATANVEELRLTMGVVDGVLHASSVGESFGYGIAEPMNFGKPVIANSVPWQDQAQIELVRPGEGGFIASTPESMAEAILKLSRDSALRARMGKFGQKHIRKLADPVESLNRLETAIQCAVNNVPNPNIAEDIQRAQQARDYLRANQFGTTFKEDAILRLFYYRVRLSQWRKRLLGA
jgi:glycosyltransferase involved in cell wall biosynthesis